MVPRQQQRDDALASIKAHILARGLSQTSVRQLAAAAGISDRMLLYYFKDKADMLSAALSSIAGDLSAGLNALLLAGERRPSAEIFNIATGVMFAPETRPYARLWMEMTSASLAQDPVITPVSQQIGEHFLDWLETRLDMEEGAARRDMALMLLGMVEGLIVLEACLGEAARKAAQSRFRDSL